MSNKNKRRNRQHGGQPAAGIDTASSIAAAEPQDESRQAAPVAPNVDFAAVKTRLAEIAEAVSDESLPLDEALDLYEEAVALGLRVSDLLEEGIELSDAADEAGESGAVENAVAESATTTPEPQVEAAAYAE